MKNNKITSHPPRSKTAQDFILEAEKKITNKERVEEKKEYPWTNGQIREDVQKVFTVRLPEEYILKIKYISEITNRSQQKIVREIINNKIDELLKSMELEG